MIVHLLCLTLALAINKSASQTMTAMPTTCISNGTLVTLRCDANDTANTILFYLNGINKGGCFSGVCNTGIAGYVQPTQSGTFTDMIITAYDSSRDGGSWTCSYGSSTSDPYTLELKNCNNPCKGVEKTTIVLCITDVAPVVVEVIIVIIIIIIDTQKVKIIVTAIKEDKQLKSAKQKINNGVEKTVNVKDEECSIDVRGGDLHACVFKTDAAVVELDFKITDDLLNVKPGSAITLPTVLLVKPDIFNKQWSHDGNIIQSNALLFHTIVTKSTYGVYGLDIIFDNLGLKILIKNMRVQARNWIIIMICVVVNVPLALIGGGVTEHYRSTDGFCVGVSVTYIAFLGPIIVYSILVMVFIYLLKKTGNEKNSGCCLPLGSCCQSSIKPNATESGQPNVVMITTENVWINTPIGRKMPDLPAIQLTNQTATGMEDKKQKKKKKKSKNQIKDSSRNDIQQSQEDTVQAIAD